MKGINEEKSNKIFELTTKELDLVCGGSTYENPPGEQEDMGYYHNRMRYETSDPSTRKKKHAGW